MPHVLLIKFSVLMTYHSRERNMIYCYIRGSSCYGVTQRFINLNLRNLKVKTS